MQGVAIDEIALHRHTGGGLFPLGFGGQARAGPARERIGFEQAQVAYRRVRVAWAPAIQGEFASVRVPIQRVLPALRLHHRPAIAEPGTGAAVATGVDELLELGVADHPMRQRMRTDQHAMTRRLVVVGEGIGLRPCRCADLHDLFVACLPAQRAGGCGRRCRGIAIGRLQRIAPQRVLDVGQQQFLVLLLVLDAELHDGASLRIQHPITQALLHLRIDRGPVVAHLLQRRSRQHPATRARASGPRSGSSC